MPLAIILPIAIPLIGAIAAALLPAEQSRRAPLAALVTMAAALSAAIAFARTDAACTLPWASFGIDLSFRLYHFSRFAVGTAASVGLLVALYATAAPPREHAKQFTVYFLLGVLFTNGAFLADNLVVMLFFWEGLLGTLFGMIAVGNVRAYRTAAKMFVIIGISDLLMMAGIALAGHLAGTLAMSRIHLPLTGAGTAAFLLIMTGAVTKAGAVPFHTWIPDAAIDAPLPFMALMPAALEKFLGIYFLTRLSLDLFALDARSWLSPLLMSIGAVTIILAVMMALVQKNFKRLLAYHAVSQVGYMILGIGTAVPAGIVGGIFHMINHAMYKSGLFLSGGSVEKQTGTTDLEKLGGLAKKMPLTFICFFVTAASISGVPPFNGFFSKELVYDGALERGMIFYVVALAGSFFTAASFLKLGHAAYFGKLSKQNENVKEAPWTILVPMITIASLCIFFGVYNYWPLSRLIEPVLGEARLEGHHFGGFHINVFLVVMTLVVLAAAVINHWFGIKKGGSGIKASDHIHYAPGLHSIYDRAEKRFFDPYDIGLNFMGLVSKIGCACDKAVDWIYNVFSVNVSLSLSDRIRRWHNGNYSTYLIWAMAGAIMAVTYLMSMR